MVFLSELSASPLFMFFLALGAGASALLNEFIGEEKAVIAVIAHKSSESSGRYECHHSLIVSDQLTYWRPKVCVNEAFWALARTGDTLRATIRQPPFGAVVTELPRGEGSPVDR